MMALDVVLLQPVALQLVDAVDHAHLRVDEAGGERIDQDPARGQPIASTRQNWLIPALAML